MSLLLEWTLAGWTLLALCWWAIAIGLVACERYRCCGRRVSGSRARPSVSIFKPIAPLREEAPPPSLVRALETFVRELDDAAEMLLGIEENDASKWQPVIDCWRRGYPRARLKPITALRPAQFLSPKVSWFQRLSEHATGEYWMWSDTDIIAPPGFLDVMRQELMDGRTGLVTCPYVVRKIEHTPMMLEALFANVEF